jgi:hypothetical protein
MTSTTISESATRVVEAVRELIHNGTATKEKKVKEEWVKEGKVGMVWRYAGSELLNELSILKHQIEDEGNEVRSSKTRSFFILTWSFRLSSVTPTTSSKVQIFRTPQSVCF